MNKQLKYLISEYELDNLKPYQYKELINALLTEIEQLESEITDLENTETEHEDRRYDLDWHIEKQTNMEFIQIYYVVNASKIISKIIQLVYGVLIAMNIVE